MIEVIFAIGGMASSGFVGYIIGRKSRVESAISDHEKAHDYAVGAYDRCADALETLRRRLEDIREVVTGATRVRTSRILEILDGE